MLFLCAFVFVDPSASNSVSPFYYVLKNLNLQQVLQSLSLLQLTEPNRHSQMLYLHFSQDWLICLVSNSTIYPGLEDQAYTLFILRTV